MRRALLCLLIALLLAGCTDATTDRTRANAELARAQAVQTQAEAFSNTLSSQNAQVGRLIDEQIANQHLWQIVAVCLLVLLVVLAGGALYIAVSINRKRPVESLPLIDLRGDPDEWIHWRGNYIRRGQLIKNLSGARAGRVLP